MKYRTDYRLAKGFLILAIIFGSAIINASLNNLSHDRRSFIIDVPLLLFFNPLVLVLLIAAFLKTKAISIDQGKLQTNYIFGLFPKEYELSNIKQVKVIERNPIGKVGGFYVLITLSYRYYIIKTIKINFDDGTKLNLDGQTLEPEDYIKLIKKLKR